MCAIKIKKKEVACTICDRPSFLPQISFPMPPLLSFLYPLCLGLIEIRSKREKEREEEKKKGSSFFLDDLVQIPSDLHERVHAVIFFFEI